MKQSSEHKEAEQLLIRLWKNLPELEKNLCVVWNLVF